MNFQKMMKILAVSGGVDSMSLLHMMYDEEIVVVHINHHTRKEENIKEENLVRNTCLSNNILFYKFDFNYSSKGNFHKEARNFRYQKFKEVSEMYGSAPIYLAHHFDDQVENILMNDSKIGSKLMKREENINGSKIIRPLLDKNKQEIYKYAKINGVSFLEDSSNNSDKYLRNRIRSILKSYTYEQKKEIYNNEFLRTQQIEELIDKYKGVQNLNLLNFKIDKLNIYCYLKAQNIISNISKNKINLISTFLKKNRNGQIHIDKDYLLINSYSNVYVCRKKSGVALETKKKIKKNNYYKFNDIILFTEYDGYLRTPKSSDKINIKNGRKKISRYFIDEKIPKEFRKFWPIIVDDNDCVIFVPRLKNVTILRRSSMRTDIFEKILISSEEIDMHCLRLAKEIEEDYKDKEPVLFLGLLKGCHPFMTDLLQYINFKLEVDYMDVSSFFGGTESSGNVEIIKDMTTSVENRDVIIVEDIVDSGRTLKKVIELLNSRGAKSIEVVTMVDKPEGRVVTLVPKYVGQEVPKAFLVGYGLDYDEYFRNIKAIGIPKDEVIKGAK